MATATAPVQNAHSPVRPPRSKWTAPGWYRVLIALPLGFLLAFGIVTLARLALHYDPTIDWNAIVTAAMITMPPAFVVGLGCFASRSSWAPGGATREEGPSGHGATKWQDYCRVNTDHRIIGI